MHEAITMMNNISHDAHRRRSQRTIRLLLSSAIALLLLGSFTVLVGSSGAAAILEEPTWHDFSPPWWINTPGVKSSVFLTSTVAPVQASARYSVSLNAGSNWVGPFSATLTNPGAQRWRLETGLVPFGDGSANRVRFAVDLAGGKRLQSEAYVVRVDTTAPVVQITAPLTGALVSAANLTIQGAATDVLSGIEVVTPTVDSQPLPSNFTPPDWSATWPVPLEDGVRHTLAAVAEDQAGNQTATSLEFTVDRVPPSNPNRITETHGILNNATLPAPIRLNFTWSGARDGSGIAGYRVYLGPQANGTGPTVVPMPAYAAPAMTQTGPHYLRISASDLAGNTAPWQTMFTVTLQSLTRSVFMPLVLIRPDWARYEPNNTIATAYGPLLSGQTYEAYIWPTGDQDYYFINITSTAADITVSLTNIPADADYDLYLYDSTPALVASSAQYGNVNEFIRYRPLASGRYVIRIYPYQGANKEQPYRLNATFQ